MAIAPQRLGIGIRRRFTTPDVHPYDTVTWERRDARITNFRDGTVAFEQLGVEVPSTWSVNATNILAQKYFRGTLGTPERETSLKQVADRVADTITAWGVKDGYFVDDAEAEAFNAELKYLIIHQKAAFNSPVWFNIGVKDVPQQASACQPYWSLVNTPDGLVPIGKLVESNAVGTKVFDAHGVTKVVAVKANGRKAVRRLHTKAGYTLDVTADHLVWRVSGHGSGTFVEAGTLVPGDQLSWVRTDGDHGVGEITELAVAEAALAGWLQSDGFVGQYEGTNRSLTIEAMTVTPDEHRWVQNAISIVFPDVHQKVRTVETQDESLDCRRIRLYGSALLDFVERYELRTRGVGMRVPEAMFSAPLPVAAAYLRSVFQAEGYVSVRERAAVIGLDMICEDLVRGVQRLLLRFGVFSRVRFKADARADRKGCWSLSIRPLGERRRFADAIGFVDERKAQTLETSFDLPGLRSRLTKVLEIQRIEDLGEQDVFDIQTESGEYLSESLRVHNCFILAVDDTMKSILNWYVEEGTIFKGGSGSGVNISKIRSSKELLQGGGTASGPVSFMRGADASAGTIKSGGKTRRAAKMVILNADHPDVRDFIWCKAVEEKKARVLRDAGFDMDLDGKDSHSIQYQNANNSVRVTDEFMQAVIDDTDWHLRAVTDGSIIETVRARDLFREISQAAWECADPGMQFDTTINKWHTAHATGRINGSNPCCFVGDTLIETIDGPVAFEQLFKAFEAGDVLPQLYSYDTSQDGVVEASVSRVWVAGHTDSLVEVRTTAGHRLRCTPEHRFLSSTGYVAASDLTPGSELRALGFSASSESDEVASVVHISLSEPVAVYDLEVPGTNNFAVSSHESVERAVFVHNSEYMHLDNSACNLASLNLLSFLNDDDTFDIDGFRSAVEVFFTAQEILVGNADYPTAKIAKTSRRFRQLGLGFANIGALLMALGLAYDSDDGRALAGAITALMTGHAYATSARIAARMGPFAGYQENREHMLRVLRMHRDEVARIDEERVSTDVLSAAQEAWDEAVELGERHGVRNSQSTVIAPTGTIGLLMDCDTTGIEPDLGLVKTKKLVGGGTMSIVNQTVPRALRRLGYTETQVEDIVAYIDVNKTIVGAPHLIADHMSVFACSMGDNTIHYLGHVKMMAAVQPFISGALSKTINLPEEATLEDVEKLHIDAWQMGLKAVAIYRDNCKVGQPLSTTKKEKVVAEVGAAVAAADESAHELAAKIVELEKALEIQTVVVKQPVRERLPRNRRGRTFKFRVADCEGYVSVGEYNDGRPGEIFIKVSKQGSTLSGVMDAFAISVSMGLQHGVPLATFVNKFTNMRFEPAGMTDDPDLRIASSIVDYIFRRLAVDYLPRDEREALGILVSDERLQQTLPGVEEAATPSHGVSDVHEPIPTEPLNVPAPDRPEAPLCYSCGNEMQRAGSCYVCSSCGSTSGCS